MTFTYISFALIWALSLGTQTDILSFPKWGVWRRVGHSITFFEPPPPPSLTKQMPFLGHLHLKMKTSSIKNEASSVKWFLEKIQISKTAVNICVSFFYLIFGCPKTNFESLSKGQSHSLMLITVLLSIFNWRITGSLLKSHFFEAPMFFTCIDASSLPPNIFWKASPHYLYTSGKP